MMTHLGGCKRLVMYTLAAHDRSRRAVKIVYCTAYSFLLVRQTDSKDLVGFVNFRFDLDDGIEVLYW